VPHGVKAGAIDDLRLRAIDSGARGVNIVSTPPVKVHRARVEVSEKQEPDDVLALWLQANGHEMEPYLSAGREIMAIE
jgi:hypothetical protein